MPSFFHSKQKISKSTISRPILQESTYQGEEPYMQIPRSPPVVPSVSQFKPKPVSHRVTTTVTQTVNPCWQPVVKNEHSRSYFHEHLSSSSDSLPSPQWDQSMSSLSLSSSPSETSLMVGDEGNSGGRKQESGTASNASPGGYPTGSAHSSVYSVRPPLPHHVQTFYDKQLPTTPPPPPPPPPHEAWPVPRTDALARGLSRRYKVTDNTFQQPQYPTQVSASQPLNTRTRTDTRMQGKWLGLGTTRVDPKELRKQENNAIKAKQRVEKEARKVEKKMAKEAYEAERK